MQTYLDSSRGTGESNECACSLVSDGGAVRVEQAVDTPDEAGPLWRVGMAHLVNQLHYHQL